MRASRSTAFSPTHSTIRHASAADTAGNRRTNSAMAAMISSAAMAIMPHRVSARSTVMPKARMYSRIRQNAEMSSTAVAAISSADIVRIHGPREAWIATASTMRLIPATSTS